MPTKERRKIVKQGKSRIISLPPSWLNFYDIQAGDYVEVYTDEEIVIKRIPHSER